MFERMIDCKGSETDAQGLPYMEIFTQVEGRRLAFEVYRVEKEGSDLRQTDATAGTPIITLRKSRNVISVFENTNKRR